MITVHKATSLSKTRFPKLEVTLGKLLMYRLCLEYLLIPVFLMIALKASAAVLDSVGRAS